MWARMLVQGDKDKHGEKAGSIYASGCFFDQSNTLASCLSHNKTIPLEIKHLGGIRQCAVLLSSR